MGDWLKIVTGLGGLLITGFVLLHWMLSPIHARLDQIETELRSIHSDIGRLAANQNRILDAMQWRGGRPVMLAGNDPCQRNP